MLRIEPHALYWQVWLDAPASRNALTQEMVEGLQQVALDAAHTPQVRALVLRGAGGHFCAGGDFSGFRALMASPAPAHGPDPIAVFNRSFGRMLQTWSDSPLFTVAVVEGAAMGGGCGLAAACDWVLADPGARLGTPELTLGLPPAQIAPFITRRLGKPAAMRFMASAQRLDAHQALHLGLVDEVSPHLDTALAHWCALWRKAEPAALRATRQIVQRVDTEPLSDTLDFAAQHFAHSLRCGTAAEGLAALRDKREPHWSRDSDTP